MLLLLRPVSLTNDLNHQTFFHFAGHLERIANIHFMGTTVFKYVQQLELLGFFSGYSLLYAVVTVFAAGELFQNNFKKRLVSLLPFSYALIGTLYLGLQLKIIHESYLTGTWFQYIYNPFLSFWALLSLLFWIPAFNKKPFLSLLHNLVFFFLLLKDIILQMMSLVDQDILKNDMKIYTLSLLLNVGSFIIVLLLSSVVPQIKKAVNKLRGSSL